MLYREIHEDDKNLIPFIIGMEFTIQEHEKSRYLSTGQVAGKWFKLPLVSPKNNVVPFINSTWVMKLIPSKYFLSYKGFQQFYVWLTIEIYW